MNNDLISREALKERIQLAPNKNEETWEELYDSIIYEIDNAPTVEHSLLPLLPLASDLDSAYMRGYEVGKAKGILTASTRPQGEWIENNFGEHYCSNCKYGAIDGEKDEILTAFCPHCGAKMKGGKEQ